MGTTGRRGEPGAESVPNTDSASSTDGNALRHAIGSLAIEFAELQFNLAHATGILIGTEESVAHVILSRLSFKNLVDLYCTLLGLRAPDQLTPPEVRLLFRELMAEETYRNTIMHSFWLPDVSVEDDGAVSQVVGAHLRIKAPSLTRKRTGADWEFVDHTTVWAHATSTKELAHRLIDILPKMPPRVVRGRRRKLSWLTADG